MAASTGLLRLLRMRNLEEEQYRAALESALAEQHRLENAFATARLRERAGRRQITRSAAGGAPPDRIAGLVEEEAGRRAAAVFARRVAEAELRVAHLRQLYLAKRVERRQAETVLREAEALALAQNTRRAQQSLDDWFGQCRHAGRIPHPPRHAPEKPEMKNGQEDTSIPEEELRTNP